MGAIVRGEDISARREKNTAALRAAAEARMKSGLRGMASSIIASIPTPEAASKYFDKKVPPESWSTSRGNFLTEYFSIFIGRAYAGARNMIAAEGTTKSHYNESWEVFNVLRSMVRRDKRFTDKLAALRNAGYFTHVDFTRDPIGATIKVYPR